MTVRVALVQSAPKLFDPDESRERFALWLARAAEGGTDLVVFPEAYVGGYPKGEHFGAPVGMRSEQGRDLYARYAAGAIEVPGPGSDAIGELAREHGVNLVIGAIERGGATLYCSALFFGRDGRLLGKRRKLMPTAAERLIWGQGDGTGLGVVPMDVGRVGAVICWENYMPLLRSALYQEGVQIYCAPTVDDRDVWVASMRHIAVEGRCFVLSACQFAGPRDYPDGWPRTAAGPLIRGGSVIVDPFGELLAGPIYGEEAILRAELDPDQITRGKYDLDVAGHYQRPDIFDLRVNDRRLCYLRP